MKAPEEYRWELITWLKHSIETQLTAISKYEECLRIAGKQDDEKMVSLFDHYLKVLKITIENDRALLLYHEEILSRIRNPRDGRRKV